MRRPIPPEKAAALPPLPRDGGMSAVEFAARAPDRPKTIRPVGPALRDRLATEVQNRIRTGDWKGAGPQHLVALYRECHAQVYRVRPLELDDGREFAFASLEAGRMLGRDFGGSVERAIEFVRWTWTREREREEWRIREGKSGSSIGWRLQFSAKLVTQYRVDLAREGKR